MPNSFFFLVGLRGFEAEQRLKARDHLSALLGNRAKDFGPRRRGPNG
jgi:hypothetical protein